MTARFPATELEKKPTEKDGFQLLNELANEKGLGLYDTMSFLVAYYRHEERQRREGTLINSGGVDL